MTRLAALRPRSRRQVLAGLMVLVGLLGFVIAVYAVVVLVGGSLLGHSGSPDTALSVVATAVVALAFDPVQTRLETAASRAVNGGRAAPYDVLRRFSETATGQYPAEELPSRIARVLAEGTGAQWSQVWLVVSGRPTLAATWPPDATREPGVGEPDPRDDAAPGRRSLTVRDAGEVLGVLVLQERPELPLTSVEERLFTGLADQAGPVLRGARLRTELARRSLELTGRAGELQSSLQRLVDLQDEKRRRLERDIHDGAQQHLVALAVNLRLAQTLAERSPERSAHVLAAQAAAARDAVTALTRLSRGIYPTELTELGVVAALRAATSTSPVPVRLEAADLGRLPANVEAAAYFCALEALQNAVKHSGASSVRVALTVEAGAVVLAVEDDGAGLTPAAVGGTGMAGMRDRVESVGGTLTVSSSAAGTCIGARLPIAGGA